MLDSVPWLLIQFGVEDLDGFISEVGVGWDELLVGGVLPGEGLGEDDDVVSSSERIWEVSDWLHDDFGVFGGGLVAGRTIIIPLWEISERLNLLGEGSGFTSETKRSINPYVFSDDATFLVEVSGESEGLFGVFHKIVFLF